MNWDLAAVGRLVATAVRDDVCKLSTFDDQLQVVAQEERWTLIVNEVPEAAGAAAECEANGDLDERFRREVGTLRFFTILFNDVDVARRSLREIALAAVRNGDTVWIDTDYGWVLHAWDFLRRTDQDPRWDWRYASDERWRRSLVRRL